MVMFNFNTNILIIFAFSETKTGKDVSTSIIRKLPRN